MLKLTVSTLVAGGVLLSSSFAALAGSPVAAVPEPAPIVAIAPTGSLGGWAPIVGAGAVVAIALIASGDSDDAVSSTPAE